MHPIICSIGPIHIYAYGSVLVLAFFTAAFLAAQEARKRGISPDLIYNSAFFSTVSGIIGARIFYVLENLQFYFKNPLEIIMLQHGGLSWFGGFALGLAAAVYYFRRKGLPIFRAFDLWAPYLALAQAIGRIGCFSNGCCFGRPAVWGIYFPAHGNVLIPTQLYSSLGLVLIFVILRLLESKPHPAGSIIYSYLILYSIKRFIIEFFRADNPPLAFGLTLFQVIAVFLFLFSLIKLFSLRKPKA